MGPTIYTIVSLQGGEVTLRVRGGLEELKTKESKLRKVS